ncbi:hypothetical protein HY642_03670 [Candidatus Woesearchaeota archaeon]|nr:hypothetical protein [Candidatus Woesearchaeota archaeon]
MNRAASKLVIDALKSSFSSSGTQAVLPAGYKIVPFSAEQFSRVEPNPSRITFIDGGNSPVLSSPSFALHKCRFAAVSYDGVRKTGRVLEEFFALATINGEKLSVSIIKDSVERGFEFSAADKSLMDGLHEATPDRAAIVARQLAELDFAGRMSHTSDLIVLDRDLEPVVSGEAERLEQLFNAAKGRLAGVSKTTRLVTDTGYPVSAALAAMAPDTAWFLPLGNKIASIGIVKLHAKAKRAFRLDVLGEPLRIANALAVHGRDPSFLGYPYGLVEADLSARVSNSEAAQARMLLLSRGGQDLERWEDILTSHAVLDSMR